MTINLARGSGAALFLALAAQAAHADLTAQDVWSDWRSYMSGAGYEITGTERSSGGSLTISDLSMTMAAPDAQATFSIEMPTLTFTENGDGTVSVGLPASIPMRIAGVGDSDEEFDAVIGYEQRGGALVVSGSPDDMAYNYTAAEVAVALSSLTVDGEPVPQEVLRASMSLKNVISSTQMQISDLRDYAQRMNADALIYEVAFDDPDSSDQGVFSGTLQGLGFQGKGSIPLEMDPSDIQKMLQQGFGFDGEFKYASGTSNVAGSGDGEEFSASTSSQGGAIAVAMDSERIAYDVNQIGSSIEFTTSEVPFPIALTMAVAEFRVEMPIAKSEEEQNVAFSLRLGNFEMSDMIWSMFDPGGVLPRDPATVALDLSGKVRILLDFLDPEVAEQLEETDAMPGELNALTINEILLSMLGTELSGKGDFSFDNSDLETFDGIPRPTGYVQLQLTGANGLLDKLIQMGFVSDQDAMGARMMMGMLAVPGQGEDTLNSMIEFNDQGHVLANGQRIQ